MKPESVPDHPDMPSVQKLVNDFFLDMWEETQASGEVAYEDISVGEVTIIGVINYRDQDDHVMEEVVMNSTTKRRFAQLGILEAAKQRHIQAVFFPEDEGHD